MILSKTSEYAVRILTFMAAGEQDRYSAKYLYEQLDIPYKYLTKLMTDLAKHGCVASIQGRDGGFTISKNLEDISIANIVEAVDGRMHFDRCVLGFDECSGENPCAMHQFWEKNKTNIISMLEGTTLRSLTDTTIFKF